MRSLINLIAGRVDFFREEAPRRRGQRPREGRPRRAEGFYEGIKEGAGAFHRQLRLHQSRPGHPEGHQKAILRENDLEVSIVAIGMLVPEVRDQGT